MSLFIFLQKAATVIFWICICHLWVILSAMVYMKIEGFDVAKQQVHFVEPYLLSVLRLPNSAREQLLHSTDSEVFLKYQHNYEKALITERYWTMRARFNDIFSAYVFVLSSHTTMGSQMFLQTWRSKAFYVFATPLGFLLYIVMVHTIVRQFFDVLAYAAVSVLPWKRTSTMDQRELFEKFKVTIFASYLLTFFIFVLALLSLVAGVEYSEGVYISIDLLFTIKSFDHYLERKSEHRGVIGFLTTLVYLISMVILYTVFYSLFILFRYNTVKELVMLLFFRDDEEFQDVIDSFDDLSIGQHESFVYYNAKVASEEARAELQETKHQLPTQESFPVTDHFLRLTDDSDATSVSSLNVTQQRRRRRRLKHTLSVTSQNTGLEYDDIDLRPSETFGSLHNVADVNPLFIPSIKVTSPSSHVKHLPHQLSFDDESDTTEPA